MENRPRKPYNSSARNVARTKGPQAKGLEMERLNASRRRDPVWERIDSIQMSENEREHAKELLRSAERFVDFAIKVVATVRSLLAPAKRAFQR